MLNNMGSSFGHFITFDLWQQALKLLNFQIAAKQRNRHFATLSIYYYERLGQAVEELEKESYFNDRVANNLFYGLEKEFSIHPYVIPKRGLGLRNYKFLTYPLRTLYYSTGLYLLSVSQEYLREYYYRQAKIRSYYGGFLSLENGILNPNRQNTYFQKYYRQFKRDMRRQLEGTQVDDRMVILIDIQNFYDSISIPTLLDKVSEYCKDTTQKQLRFDPLTKDQITSFFKYLMSGSDGIPQADNDLVSSFIGSLYLSFADLLIEDHLKEECALADYELIRYMDDMAISLTFDPDVSRLERENIVESLASRFADKLFYELGLKLNEKTRMFWLGKVADRIDFENTLKKVSPQYYLADDDNEETPGNKVNNILDELKKLKESHIAINFQHELQDEILKEVFDPSVQKLLSSSANQRRIRAIFTDFNFGLIRVSPLPMIVVLLKDAYTSAAFSSYLISKNPSTLTTNDLHLMLVYLCQVNFEDDAILDKLYQFGPMQSIVEKIREADLALECPGYYDLIADKVLSLKDKPYVIDQIRLRVLSEMNNSFSVALNHLLNEVHAVCYDLDPISSKGLKNYDARSVEAFLKKKGSVPHKNIIKIKKLFDRRNTNQVSHPGSEQNISWGVSEQEYMEFKRVVGETLQRLL